MLLNVNLSKLTWAEIIHKSKLALFKCLPSMSYPTSFGRVRLELNGYQYMVKNNKGDRCYWKCIIPLCPATANTHYETITKSANYHTHAPNSARVKAGGVINIIKEGKTTQRRLHGYQSRTWRHHFGTAHILREPHVTLQIPQQRKTKITDHPYWYITWGQMDTDLGTRTVLIRRRRQRRYNSHVYYSSQPHQPGISRHHLWRWHFPHFTNSIYSTLHTTRNGRRYHVPTRLWTTTR